MKRARTLFLITFYITVIIMVAMITTVALGIRGAFDFPFGGLYALVTELSQLFTLMVMAGWSRSFLLEYQEKKEH